jgi:hypothetical protein
MSTLYVTEVTALGIDAGGQNIMAPAMPPALEQTVPISGSSAASGPFGGTTRFVQLHTDAICSVAFNVPGQAPPTATTSNQRLAANETRFYTVAPGGQVAVISNI